MITKDILHYFENRLEMSHTFTQISPISLILILHCIYKLHPNITLGFQKFMLFKSKNSKYFNFKYCFNKKSLKKISKIP